MGREIKRVPLDFAFPVGDSWPDHHYEVHQESCEKGDHDDCDYSVDVPRGEGWQLWQTVSDGPTSPVFATADELIEWMCQPVPLKDRPHFAPEAYPSNPWAQGWRRKVAEPFVRQCGWAPSFVQERGKVLDGPTWAVREAAQKKVTP